MSAIQEVSLGDTLNRGWKDDKTGFGFRMLQKMGWKEDTGLGKNSEGMVEAIKVKRRSENTGIGVSKDHAGASGWTKTVSGFGAVLEMLNATTDPTIKKLKKSKKKKKHRDEDIQVRIKYKKVAMSKDFSLKSDAEKAAILGTKFNEGISDDHKIKRSKEKKSRTTSKLKTYSKRSASDDDTSDKEKSPKKKKKKSD